jgi:beta-xylosidase
MKKAFESFITKQCIKTSPKWKNHKEDKCRKFIKHSIYRHEDEFHANMNFYKIIAPNYLDLI